MKLHEKVRALREYRKISQEEACLMYGITRPTLSQREKGVSDFHVWELQNIAESYGCSPADLMDGTNKITISL